MNRNMRFSVLVLAVWLSVNLTGCIASHSTYSYDLRSTSATTDCLALGQLDGKLDLTVVRGKRCHRFRITDHIPNYHYLEIHNDSTSSPHIDLTISQPRLGGSYQAGQQVGSLLPGRCTSQHTHYLNNHLEPERDYSVAIVAISSLLCAGALMIVLVNQGIKALQSRLKRQRSPVSWREKFKQIYSRQRWADEFFPMLVVMLLPVLLGILGIRQALFSMRYWQMSAADACRLVVQSWF